MVGVLGITEIAFKVGSAPEKPPLVINPGTVLVFVGPNNSGKSVALKEIEAWCFGQDVRMKVIDTVKVSFPVDPEEGENLLRVFETEPPQNQATPLGSMWVAQHRFRSEQPNIRIQIQLDTFKSWISNKQLLYLRGNLLSFYTVRLDGRTRFSLTDQKPTGDLLQSPQNHLWALFQDDSARERVRKLTEEAFPGNYFVIDPTSMSSFRIRLSPRPPNSKGEEQALDETSRNFHKNSPLIDEFSDGVKAFVGLTSAILSLPHRIMLIDEPDAFLHPPLARRLGSNLTKIARERNASLICATHSPEFLIGCIETDSDTSIVRLTFKGGFATARNLSSTEVKDMASDPLLRSTDVLNALFHTAAVVCESDTDRAFYGEVNRRLVSVNRGISDSIFLNAQNWQTIWRLIKPLRNIGMPAAAILDLDIIRNTGREWHNILEACRIPQSVKPTLDSERDRLSNALSALDDVIKRKGIYALNGDDKKQAESFLSKLGEYGLFLVPNGELESWLQYLGVSGHGANWLYEIFKNMGSSDSDPSYLAAQNNDVWDFLDRIAKWVNDPNRLGTE